MVLLIFSVYFLSGLNYMPDSDIFRVYENISSSDFGLYEWREPIYWAVTKFLYGLGVNESSIVWLLTLISIGLFSLRLIPHKGNYFLFCSLIILSPLFVLGIVNIHRQFLAVLIYCTVVFGSQAHSISKILIGSVLCGMIHNSIFAIGLVNIMAYLLYSKRHIDFFILTFSAFCLINLPFLDYYLIGFFFREGTDVNSSITIYIIWTSLILLFVYKIFGIKSFGFIFFLLGSFFSIGLFYVSGGSSGMRFLISFQFILLVLLFQKSRINPNNVVHFAFILLMLLPVFMSEFSRSIIFMPIYSSSWLSV